MNFVQNKEHLMVKFLAGSQAKESLRRHFSSKIGRKLQRKFDIFIFKRISV